MCTIIVKYNIIGQNILQIKYKCVSFIAVVQENVQTKLEATMINGGKYEQGLNALCWLFC